MRKLSHEKLGLAPTEEYKYLVCAIAHMKVGHVVTCDNAGTGLLNKKSLDSPTC